MGGQRGYAQALLYINRQAAKGLQLVSCSPSMLMGRQITMDKEIGASFKGGAFCKLNDIAYPR